jgi:hypothetical protein
LAVCRKPPTEWGWPRLHIGLATATYLFQGEIYADVVLAPGAAVPLPDEHEGRAAYVLKGEVAVAGDRFEPGRMLVFRAQDRLMLRAGPQGDRLLLLGGAVMDAPRYLFWNFVSSRRERLEQANRLEAARFGTVPGDEAEFIPLPAEEPVAMHKDEPNVGLGLPTS